MPLGLPSKYFCKRCGHSHSLATKIGMEHQPESSRFFGGTWRSFKTQPHYETHNARGMPTPEYRRYLQKDFEDYATYAEYKAYLKRGGKLSFNKWKETRQWFKRNPPMSYSR